MFYYTKCSDVKEDEIRVTISLLTKNNNAGQAHSTLGRRASFMFFGPKRTDLSSQSADSNSSMGLTLGEVTFTFKAGVGKSSVKPFSLMSPNGKKEVAKVMIQTGLFMDQEYSHEEELLAKKEVVPEPDVAEYANFLNVMMYAKSVCL